MVQIVMLYDEYLETLELTLLHSERPKLYAILAFLSTIRLTKNFDINPSI